MASNEWGSQRATVTSAEQPRERISRIVTGAGPGLGVAMPFHAIFAPKHLAARQRAQVDTRSTGQTRRRRGR